MLRFNNTGFVVSVNIALPNGDASSTHELFVGNAPTALALPLNHTSLAETVRRMGRNTPISWRQLAAYQNSRVWANEYRTVRFYAGLDPAARAALLENRLPFSTLSPAQQQEALSLLSASHAAMAPRMPADALLGLQSNLGKEVISFNNLPRLRLCVVSPQAQPSR
ncbi:MAG TPA: hypothetical protein VFB38_21665 [Chthonomonadaceae bacterium]|nr:hypothetical protein [Chthonomonadaceae bacterium]